MCLLNQLFRKHTIMLANVAWNEIVMNAHISNLIPNNGWSVPIVIPADFA
jgi:hypothetical protein